MMHITENQDALLDYLYEEGDAADRLAIAQHLQECAACAVAVVEFQNVRGMLIDWKSPASELGFRIVQDATLSVPVSHSARSGWWQMPRLQAAAAVLLFAAGLAVSQLNVDYRDGRLIVSVGETTPPADIRSASITLPAENVNRSPNTDEIVRQVVERLGPNASAGDTEQLFQRVRAMIDQSEQRQQRELAQRLMQVSREFDTQHKVDLLKIEQDFGKQQEALEYIVRTSGVAK